MISSEQIGFKLCAPYEASGDQPNAIEKLVKDLQCGNSKAVLVGVTGSGKTMTMASTLARLNKPTLVITHNKTLAAQLYREFKDFFPENAVEYFISYYDYYQPEAYVPVSDTYIEKEATINEEIEMLRLRATSSLIERRDVIIVSSVSCIYGLGSPEAYRKSVLMVHNGEPFAREEAMAKLIKMQYHRNDQNFSRGTFRARGDTLEILPAYSGDGIRIEFFGDEVENISKFDALTGKVKINLPLVAIYPAKHFITEEPLLEMAIKDIKEELEQQKLFFESQNKPLEQERIQQRTLFDLEMLREMGYCNGIENYSRHLTRRSPGSRPECLIDYFPDDFLMIIDESHVSIPQIRGMFEGDRSRKQTLVDFGFRLPSALDNRPLNFEEFETLARNILFVSATPAEYELKYSDSYVEQVVRPTGLLDPAVKIRPTDNQINDLLKELKARADSNERTLITTLTKKMAEDVTEYLLEQGVQVRYIHSDINSLERVEILRDLRKGEFDVLVGINLLREGLDLPEVSLVVILDADKEGFLRSGRALIQTMGRAARNVNGTVIMYGDKITRSMREAIDETERRRSIQEKYNQEHGVTPRSIQKAVVDIIERDYKDENSEEKVLEYLLDRYDKNKFKNQKERKLIIKREMLSAAENLDFERAAILRDMLN